MPPLPVTAAVLPLHCISPLHLLARRTLRISPSFKDDLHPDQFLLLLLLPLLCLLVIYSLMWQNKLATAACVIEEGGGGENLGQTERRQGGRATMTRQQFASLVHEFTLRSSFFPSRASLQESGAKRDGPEGKIIITTTVLVLAMIRKEFTPVVRDNDTGGCSYVQRPRESCVCVCVCVCHEMETTQKTQRTTRKRNQISWPASRENSLEIMNHLSPLLARPFRRQ